MINDLARLQRELAAEAAPYDEIGFALASLRRIMRGETDSARLLAITQIQHLFGADMLSDNDVIVAANSIAADVLADRNFPTELTPEGEQHVIPGCERNLSPKAKQLDLFG